MMPLCMEVSLSPGDFVLHGDPAPVPKRGRSPQFSAHVYCGQTAGWIIIALGMEVGLSPGDVVLDRDLATLPKGSGAHSPIFGQFLLWRNAYSPLQKIGVYGGFDPKWAVISSRLPKGTSFGAKTS